MRLNMVSDETIRRLSLSEAEGSSSTDAREAARATGGVPAYEDLGGVLVVFGDGRVMHFDPDAKTVRAVSDPKWRSVALVKAAAKFSELASLVPSRPPDAATCPTCHGDGTLLGGVLCGVCGGSGWVES
jgi:hypothetical protein